MIFSPFGLISQKSSRRGRTGTVVGCHLARHGHASGQKIMEFIKDFRKNTEDHVQSSPETSGQIGMVLSWVEGE